MKRVTLYVSLLAPLVGLMPLGTASAQERA